MYLALSIISGSPSSSNSFTGRSLLFNVKVNTNCFLSCGASPAFLHASEVGEVGIIFCFLVAPYALIKVEPTKEELLFVKQEDAILGSFFEEVFSLPFLAGAMSNSGSELIKDLMSDWYYDLTSGDLGEASPAMTPGASGLLCET